MVERRSNPLERIIPFYLNDKTYLFIFERRASQSVGFSSETLYSYSSIRVLDVTDFELESKDVSSIALNDYQASRPVRIYGTGGTKEGSIVGLFESLFRDPSIPFSENELAAMTYCQIGNVITFVSETFPPFYIRKEGNNFVYYRNVLDMSLQGDRETDVIDSLSGLPYSYYGYGLVFDHVDDSTKNTGSYYFDGYLKLNPNHDKQGISEKNTNFWINRPFITSVAKTDSDQVILVGGIIRSLTISSRGGEFKYRIRGELFYNEGLGTIEEVIDDLGSEETDISNLYLCDWTENTGWPRCVTEYENRFVFAGNQAYPAKVWFSSQPSVQRVPFGNKVTITDSTSTQAETRTEIPIFKTVYFDQLDLFNKDQEAIGLVAQNTASAGSYFINSAEGLSIYWIVKAEVLYIGTNQGVYVSQGTDAGSSNPIPFNTGFQQIDFIPVKRTFPIVYGKVLYFITQDNSVRMIEFGSQKGRAGKNIDSFSREIVRDASSVSTVSRTTRRASYQVTYPSGQSQESFSGDIREDFTLDISKRQTLTPIDWIDGDSNVFKGDFEVRAFKYQKDENEFDRSLSSIGQYQKTASLTFPFFRSVTRPLDIAFYGDIFAINEGETDKIEDATDFVIKNGIIRILGKEKIQDGFGVFNGVVNKRLGLSSFISGIINLFAWDSDDGYGPDNTVSLRAIDATDDSVWVSAQSGNRIYKGMLGTPTQLRIFPADWSAAITTPVNLFRIKVLGNTIWGRSASGLYIGTISGSGTNVTVQWSAAHLPPGVSNLRGRNFFTDGKTVIVQAAVTNDFWSASVSGTGHNTTLDWGTTTFRSLSSSVEDFYVTENGFLYATDETGFVYVDFVSLLGKDTVLVERAGQGRLDEDDGDNPNYDTTGIVAIKVYNGKIFLMEDRSSFAGLFYGLHREEDQVRSPSVGEDSSNFLEMVSKAEDKSDLQSELKDYHVDLFLLGVYNEVRLVYERPGNSGNFNLGPSWVVQDYIFLYRETEAFPLESISWEDYPFKIDEGNVSDNRVSRTSADYLRVNDERLKINSWLQGQIDKGYVLPGDGVEGNRLVGVSKTASNILNLTFKADNFDLSITQLEVTHNGNSVYRGALPSLGIVNNSTDYGREAKSVYSGDITGVANTSASGWFYYSYF